ncbi:MAG: hypothetical protein ACK4TP_11090 [Hyphomicrobium sp.]
MDRREFLKSTGAAAAATAAAATGTANAEAAPSAPAVGLGLRELRLAMSCGDGFAGQADWAHRLARNINELSGGRFRVMPAFGVADPAAAVCAGDADLCFDTAGALIDIHRGFAYFAGLPGDLGLTPRRLQTWIAVGGGQALWDDLAHDVGLKPLLAAHTGPQSLMLASTRISSMAALAGIKVQVGGLARDVARGLGMDVVSVAPGELASAMQHGSVQVAECGGAILSYALGLPAVAPFSTGAGISQNGTSMYLGVRNSVWDSLSPGDQAVLATAANSEFQLSLAEEEAHRYLLYPAPTADRVWPIAADLAHAIERVAAAVVAHTAGADARSRRIADSHAAFKRSAAGLDAYA